MENKIKYEINTTKFGVRLALLRIKAIEEGKKVDNKRTRIYNIVELKKHFKLNCLLKEDEKVEVIDDDD